jgi:hypothetical protein
MPGELSETVARSGDDHKALEIVNIDSPNAEERTHVQSIK